MSDRTIRFAAVPSSERERFDAVMEDRCWTCSFLDEAVVLVDAAETDRELIHDAEVPPRYTYHSAPAFFAESTRRLHRPFRQQALPPRLDCPSLNRLLTSYGRLRGSESGDASGDDPDDGLPLQYPFAKRPAGCPAPSGWADHAGLFAYPNNPF